MKRVWTMIALAALLALAASVALAQREARPDEPTAPQLTAEQQAVVQQAQDLGKQLRISRLELALAEAKDASLSDIAKRAEQVYRLEGQLYALRAKNPELAAQLWQGRGCGRAPGWGRRGPGEEGLGGWGRGRGPGMGGRGMGRHGMGHGGWQGMGPGDHQGMGGRGMGRHGMGHGGWQGMGPGDQQGMGGRGLGRGRGMGRGQGMGPGVCPMAPGWDRPAPQGEEGPPPEPAPEAR